MNSNVSFLVTQMKESRELSLVQRFYTVGAGAGFDVIVDAKQDGHLFSLLVKQDSAEIITADAKIDLNGKRLKSGGLLRNLDRISWEGGAAIAMISTKLIDDQTSLKALEPLKFLERLSSNLQQSASFPVALHQLLDFVVENSGAQNCALFWESENASWDLIARRASHENVDLKPKTLLSQTILKQAVSNKDLVYVESLVGHDWAKALSVVENNLYSVAVLPLVLEEQVRGALFLSTQEAGKSLKKDGLEELRSVTTIASLIVMAYKQIEAQKVNMLESKRVRLSESKTGLERLVGSSSKIKNLKLKLKKLSPTPLPVYIQGESGVGKELVAKALHEDSARSAKPFVALNCAAIPESLVESILFGHVKGAFTGANTSKIGKFEQADGGTLFLDEIGDLPLELQAKLLRVLQESMVEPVGASNPRKVDVRIVCATHRDLKEMVSKKQFREDLFYRIATTCIEVPPLRERSDDIISLAELFVSETGTEKTLSSEAQDVLKAYAWPGNIRELKHALERAAYLSEGVEIMGADLELNQNKPGTLENVLESDFLDMSLKTAQKAFTRSFIERVLQSSEGGRTEAASRLGVSERTLYRMLEEPTQ